LMKILDLCSGRPNAMVRYATYRRGQTARLTLGMKPGRCAGLLRVNRTER